MPEIVWFAKAVFAGFVVAVPVGVVGALCVRRAFVGRRIDALFTGLGAAAADAVLATGALLGLSLITRYVLEHERPVRLVGGLLLIGIGLLMIRDRHRPLNTRDNDSDLSAQRWRYWLAHMAAGFGLTIINPATLIGFVGIFAGLGMFAGGVDSLLVEWFIVLGALCGSLLWWSVLTLLASVIRHHAPTEVIAVTNVVIGLVLVVLGTLSLSGFRIEV